MKKNLFKTLMYTLCFMLSASMIWATAEEATMEQNLADKAQRLLDGVFGKGQLIAIVNVSVSAPRYEVKYTRQSQAAVTNQKNNGGEKSQILPGYPVIRNLAPENYKQLPFDSVTSYTKPSITQISVSVIASQDFPKNQLGRVQSLLEQNLGLNTNRDKVQVTVQKFMASTAESKSEPSKAVQAVKAVGSAAPSIIQTLLMMVGIGFFAAFIALYFIMQQRQQKLFMQLFQQSLGAQNNSKGGGGESNINLTPSFEMPKSDRSGPTDINVNSDPKMKRYFDFISDHNIDKLLYILRRESVSVENLAVLIPCLPAHLAAQVLAELDAKNQAAITLNMLDPKMFNKGMIEKFENQLKNAMECLIGGEVVVKNMIQEIPNHSKKQLLAILNQSNPEGYQRVRPFIVVFEDLSRLNDDEVKTVINMANRDLLSTALAGADTSTYQKFEANMPRSNRDMLTEFMELRGKNLNNQAIDHAQEAILQQVLRLEREGRLNLREKLG